MEKRTLQPNKEDAGKRIDAWLSTVLENTTRSAAQRLLEDGCVEIGGKVPAKNYKLTGCEEATVLLPEPEQVDVVPQDIPLDVVYEDEDGFQTQQTVNDPALLAELERIKAEKLNTVDETQVRLFGGGA